MPNIPERSHSKRIVFLSRIHPKKGISELVKAWISLPKESLYGWRLDIYGWGEELHVRDLKSLLDTHGADSTIAFHGPVFGDEKEKVLKEASLYILPSKSEGMPVSVLEAWSFGIPVIMTEFCNLNVGFDSNAALKIGCSEGAIREKLLNVLAMDYTTLIEMGIRGRILVEEQFSMEKVLESYGDVYRWVLDGGKKPNCMV
jgi:poly(glycerol-phosphate) alpha-glucosyltransferase